MYMITMTIRREMWEKTILNCAIGHKHLREFCFLTFSTNEFKEYILWT